MKGIKREKVASLWRTECVWTENDDDNNGVQVGLKVDLE